MPYGLCALYVPVRSGINWLNSWWSGSRVTQGKGSRKYKYLPKLFRCSTASVFATHKAFSCKKSDNNYSLFNTDTLITYCIAFLLLLLYLLLFCVYCNISPYIFFWGNSTHSIDCSSKKLIIHLSFSSLLGPYFVRHFCSLCLLVFSRLDLYSNIILSPRMD